MVAPIKARDALHERLKALFGSEAFKTLYPEAKVPKVTLGFPTDEPPFYVAVDEIIDTSTTSGAVSMGHVEFEFGLGVWLFARHADLKTASNTLLCYMDAVMNAVCADHTLNGSVDNSFVSVESAGTSADSSKRYMAAASMGIQCTVHSICPKEIKEACKCS